MRGPKPDQLSLTEVERNELEQVVRHHSTAQQIALRGRIITSENGYFHAGWCIPYMRVLEANASKNNSQIARELGLSVETERVWRKRWLALQTVALADLSVQDRRSSVPRPEGGARSPQNKPASSSR